MIVCGLLRQAIARALSPDERMAPIPIVKFTDLGEAGREAEILLFGQERGTRGQAWLYSNGLTSADGGWTPAALRVWAAGCEIRLEEHRRLDPASKETT